jgi:hypothetical protein
MAECANTAEHEQSWFCARMMTLVCGNNPVQKLTHPVTFSTDPSISSDDLRRQSKPAKKGLAHSPWIKEAGLTRDEISGVATLFHHQSGGFKTKTLHGFSRRLACFGAKGTAKLAETEMYRFSQLLNG